MFLFKNKTKKKKCLNWYLLIKWCSVKTKCKILLQQKQNENVRNQKLKNFLKKTKIKKLICGES